MGTLVVNHSMRCTHQAGARPCVPGDLHARGPAVCLGRSGPATDRLRRRAGRHHPSDLGRISHRRHRSRRHRRRRSRRHHPAHARWTARLNPDDRVAHDHVARASGGVRGPGGRTCGLGRVRADDGRRCCGDGARHTHRRSASGVWWRAADGRDDREEGGFRRSGVCAIARRSAPSQRDARRSSRHREPCLHGY